MESVAIRDRALRWRLMGANLRRLRDLMGESQEEIARVLGVSHAQVSKFERGQAAMTFDQVTLLARHWDIPVLTLIEELGTPIDRDAPRFADWYGQFRHKRSGGPGDRGDGAPVTPGRRRARRALTFLCAGAQPAFA